ncbi:hypothetical protein SAMN04488134_11364 [Amphibacillus marinus]|uniref:Uncharacterized protein n=1 Tax=Amphibacillus marinus TaxID=872970 RepID=A0A1H8SNY8_9BACI|nr:hypothetical protein [Amphibacillus marinus]SEO80669.1 hypothetical protein SAMN04488134_11364 [Amphibacillus marinus]
MYLERVKAKGKTYLYVRKYCVRPNYSNNTKTVFRFGRIEKALKQLYSWQLGDKLPNELVKEGCTRQDIADWINTLETGIHKTGRSFAEQTDIFEYLG